MKKFLIFLIIIILIVAIIVAAAIAYWLASKSESEPGSKKSEEFYFSVLESDSVVLGQKYTYQADSAEFIIYPPDLETFDFGYFQAYNKGELIYESAPQYAILDLMAFETNDGKYVVVSDYSGGAHCCFTEYIFFLNNGDLKLVKEVYTGNAGIREESLTAKDDNLYIKVFDDRFAYFYTSYVTSYFFPQYLLVDNDNIEINNESFLQDYSAEAQKCEQEISQMLPDSSLTFEDYSPKLVCVAVNYIISGREDLAWQKVEDYFAQVPLDFYGSEVESESFKSDFLELYQLEAFSQRNI